MMNISQFVGARCSASIRRMQFANTKDSGFTLIEMAMVLVIIGLIVSMGTQMLKTMTKRSMMVNSTQIAKTAYESILGYAISNKKLPADLTTLGVKTTDAYNSNLKYYVVPEFTASSFCTNNGTYLLLNDSSSGSLISKTDIAFLILSAGEDRTNSTGAASTFTVLPQSNTYDDIVFYLDIKTLREKVCNTFGIVTDSLPTATKDFVYSSATLAATDGTEPYTWSIASGALPAGLSLSNAGVISGTPTVDGSFPFNIQVVDNDTPQRQANKTLSITVQPNDPKITTEYLYNGTNGVNYVATLSATNGLLPYTWSLTSGPGTLAVSAGGIITWNPAVTGTYMVTVQVTDSHTKSVSKTLSLTVF
ncbi:MAG: putative Ig domain-containing protein [Nitrospirae bacterium]|nr:putative Ig domain-containing protein [Nitrospirota bacterium]